MIHNEQRLTQESCAQISSARMRRSATATAAAAAAIPFNFKLKSIICSVGHVVGPSVDVLFSRLTFKILPLLCTLCARVCVCACVFVCVCIRDFVIQPAATRSENKQAFAYVCVCVCLVLGAQYLYMYIYNSRARYCSCARCVQGGIRDEVRGRLH